MIIQIYETRTPEEARRLVKLGVDNIGVLVGKGEYAGELGFKEAKRIFRALPKGIKGVALSLSCNLNEIIELVKKVGPDILHLGALPEKFSLNQVQKLKQQFPKLKVMRAIPVINKKSINLAKKYEKIADYLLLDTFRKKGSQLGVTGKTHNWDISRKIVETVKIPVILAGGLGPENIREAIKKVKPAGVDSKTKTDRADGQGKDFKKVKEFAGIAKSFKIL